MLVSILHRATGTALATAAVIGFVWWLTAASIGAEAYQRFYECATSWIGKVIGIGLTWTFFQHLFSGLRHLVLDTGAGYELRSEERRVGKECVIRLDLGGSGISKKKNKKKVY